MSLPKIFARVAVLACCAWLTVAGAYGDDFQVEPRSFLPRIFDAAIKHGETIGWEQVRRVFITCGTNEYFFIVPQGLRINAGTDKVTLVSSDSSYFLTFRIRAVAGSIVSNTDVCRKHVLNQFPEARILNEYSKTAGGREGPIYSLRGKVDGSLDRAMRMALIPSSCGVLEFTLNADLPKSSEGELAFNMLLRTFRSNEAGKLEVVLQASDKS